MGLNILTLINELYYNCVYNVHFGLVMIYEKMLNYEF